MPGTYEESSATGAFEPVTYHKLSVVVPVFNERNTVGEIVRRMRAVELPGNLDLEIIVIDDGSTDGTGDVLAQLRDSTVRVVSQKQNEGKGTAVRAGFDLSTGDLVLVQDADLEYDPEDWPRSCTRSCVGSALVVYGSRFTGERRNMLFLHWVGNRFLSLVTNVLYNTTLSDMETCYKLIDRRVIDRVDCARNASRSNPSSPRRSSRWVCASTRCRSRTPGVSSTRARRSPGATASPRCGRWRSIRFTD